MRDRLTSGVTVVDYFFQGYEHILNPRSPKPELFNPNEVIGEQNDILNQHPEVAQWLLAQWQKWDEMNVAMRNPVFADCYRASEELFLETMLEDAKQEGYAPEFKRQYPPKK